MSSTIQHVTALKASVTIDPRALALVPVKDGQEVVTVRVNAGGRVVRVEMDAADLRRILNAIAKDWPAELAVAVNGELRGDVLTRTDLSIAPAIAGQRIRPHRMRKVYQPRKVRVSAVAE
jgi:hypothetical protein